MGASNAEEKRKEAAGRPPPRCIRLALRGPGGSKEFAPELQQTEFEHGPAAVAAEKPRRHPRPGSRARSPPRGGEAAEERPRTTSYGPRSPPRTRGGIHATGTGRGKLP